MNIDDMVRDALHSHADDAPPSAGLLAAAHTRARRRRMQHAAVAVAVGVATGLVAISIPFGASVGDGPTVPGSDPPPTFPPVELAPAAVELPSFPFTPSWTPEGIEEPYVSYNQFFGAWSVPELLSGQTYRWEGSGPHLSLVHPPVTEAAEAPLMVEVHTEDPTANLERFAEAPVTLHDRPGVLYQVDEDDIRFDFVVIAWQHEPDQWVLVRGSGVDATDVERYAQELDETPIQPAAPFTFDLLPAGVELTGFDPDSMQFHRSDGVSVHVRLERPDSTGLPTDTPGPTESADVPTGGPQSPEPGPTASGEPGHLSSPPPPQPIPTEVDGREAQLLQWTESTELRVRLGGGMVLNVTGFQMNPDDLILVAEGIELTE